MWKNSRLLTSVVAACLLLWTVAAHAQDTLPARVVVQVQDDDTPVVAADVQIGTAHQPTDAAGRAVFTVSPGRLDVVVTKEGYDAGAAQVDARAGEETRIEVALEPQSAIEETITVSATRTDRRIEDEPVRVEVVPAE